MIIVKPNFSLLRADGDIIKMVINIYMLFTGREVRIGKNCALGLEYGPRPQDQGHSFSLYGPPGR